MFILFQFYQSVFITIVVLGVQVHSYLNEPNSEPIPDSFDWRTRGVIAPVQDYSDYPFVAGIVMVEAIETLHAIATGTLQRGSVARVRDCCANGGVLSDCIQKLGGICAYDDYPTARHTCEPNACKPFTSFEKIDHFREQNDSVLVPLIQNGTFLVGFDSSERSFAYYEGGVYKEKNCSQTLDSTVLQVVGYGSTEVAEPYWIAKNSWGEEWGEKGYIRILRGENICGIGLQVYQPLISTTTSRANEIYFSLNKILFFVVLFDMISYCCL